MIPGAIGVLSLAAIIEMSFHVRHGYEGDHEMALFWVNWDTHSILPWAVFGVLTIGGFWLAKKFAPEMKEAWDNANVVGN